MKKWKWLGASGAVLALGTVGFVSAPSAEGAVTVVAGTGSSVTCTITGSVKISPALANNWVKSQHTNDPNTNATIKAAMASIPDTTYSAGAVPVTTTSKTTASCTGNAVDGANHTAVTAASITSTSITDGALDSTCTNIGAGSGSTPLHSIIKWTGATLKIAPSTVTSSTTSLSDSHGVGFDITPTSTTGSFQGGSGETKAYVGGDTILALLIPASTYDSPGGSICQASIGEKFTAASAGVSDSVALKLKKPKGLKSITIGPGSIDNAASTLTSHVP